MLTNRARALYAIIAVMVSVLSACVRTEAIDGNTRTEAVHSRFDAGAWKAGTSAARSKMADDLIDHRLLIGKTRAEVKSLLGEPDLEGSGFLGYFISFGADDAAHAAYLIRVELGQRGEVVRDAHLDADIAPGYSGSD